MIITISHTFVKINIDLTQFISSRNLTILRVSDNFVLPFNLFWFCRLDIKKSVVCIVKSKPSKTCRAHIDRQEADQA